MMSYNDFFSLEVFSRSLFMSFSMKSYFRCLLTFFFKIDWWFDVVNLIHGECIIIFWLFLYLSLSINYSKYYDFKILIVISMFVLALLAFKIKIPEKISLNREFRSNVHPYPLVNSME